MLSKLTLIYLFTVINLGHLGGALPFRCTKGVIQKAPISSQIPWRIFHCANKILNFTYVAFVFYRLLTFVITPTPPKYERFRLPIIVQLLYVLICYNLNIVNDVETWHRGDVMPYFISQYVKLYARISTDHVSSPAAIVHCNAFLTVLFIVGNLICLQNFALMMKKPSRLHFFTSLLQHLDKAQQVHFKLPLIVLQSYVWYNLWTSIFFYVFSVFIYNCGGIQLLRELK